MLGGNCRYQQAGDSAAAPAPSFGELLGGSAVAHRIEHLAGIAGRRYARRAGADTPRKAVQITTDFCADLSPAKNAVFSALDNTDFSDGFLYGPAGVLFARREDAGYLILENDL